ncbi:MAG: hypothetical protein A2087_12705 [Spirochaetes bacterium GWD1_61_31]|nr:MAG: hypothetical protein A2Y37_05745 [Spirochaetes bacterium GWB1_60_80]OHD34522.1 MAG: hypothetical protein A2004_08865 [Spirochaetes bacterium GWC1_61_12]OHD38125.1 MAG: hypothetical protein A2087_12705 [Spirochaetes bacterium GWD1_61_31]OHD42967.1 MAG: hypothetical protein A2Y35_14165 [Spirochaetes bacterium GWE1_60_18]
MIIAIPTDDKLTVSKVFGRAAWFALFRAADAAPEFIVGNADSEHGAGTSAVAKLVELGVTEVCAPELGPKAYDALAAAAIPATIVKAGTPLAQAAHRQ